MSSRARRVGATIGLFLAAGLAAEAYLKFGVEVGGRTELLRWTRLPVRYVVNPQGVDGVTGEQLAETVRRAFATWQAVATATVDFEFAGFASAGPDPEDGLTVLGFEARPELDRVLGATSYTMDTRTGEIVEADVFLNARFPWSVAPGGEPGRFDLESVALHEAGHVSGLGHSALGETELRAGGGRRVVASGAAMFPIAFTAGNIDGRWLRADDVAGVSDMYPDAGFRAATGSVSGRVTRNGRGVFGAHVVAFNLETGALVGNFSLDADGAFAIAGLEAGPTVLRVEPLDDAELDSFFNDVSRVDVDFRATYYERIVAVPRGGGVSGITVAVSPKS